MRRLLLWYVLCFADVSIAAFHQKDEAAQDTQIPMGEVAKDPLSGDFSKTIKSLLDKWNVPGLAVGVIDGNDTWVKGYGVAQVSPRVPVTPQTLFYGGSTTKAFTGAAVARLINSGQYRNPSFPEHVVDWKTPISEILPEDFVLQDEWSTAHITLEDALTHRTGMAAHDWAYGGERPAVKEIVRSMRHLPINQPPRTKWQYCNLMYITASHAVETLTSLGLGHVLKEWIWQPLGMDSTFWHIDDARAAGEQVAVGYYWEPKEKAFKEIPYVESKAISGAGAILSNVVDYSKWVRALVHEDGFLSKDTHDAIKMPRMFNSGSGGNYDAPTAYALGWVTSTYKGHRIWFHGGATDAFGSNVIFFPDLKFGVVTLANSAFFGNAIGEIVSFELADDRLGLSQEERADWGKSWRQTLDQGNSLSDKAEDILYPGRPKQAVKPTLPLESYTGTYFSPGWRNMTITLIDENTMRNRRPKAQLRVHRPDSSWSFAGELEHVTGEYWILYSSFATLPVQPLEISPLDFRIGADGKIAGLELEFGNAPKGAGEGVVSFEKIA
ncbi:beta-lactamase/transpeptidase-like protein [Truncatella angustata]|uniref:Beta-lactamase/transpeptidase-like protein n=1 Tax=Truncatella angustata TaxID=152316 RepID=A0A9P8UDM7_9PEZI|nr:beta-lactamase/transpeptidase-like protein [Truncatella angustata]KAH6647997.1 beta-lactamase/transpeptidase-like protein [Truncatella angustata]